ncbi:MAG TPA: class I SAM-dependent methyltransferase [Tepidiformaceae bacterium]|nr:class I SAM-dependent methyltransferase [Tepidiformaceae bacterium]
MASRTAIAGAPWRGRERCTDPAARYIDGGFEKVDGFLVEGAVTLIAAIARKQENLGVRGHVCEIGVHQGRAFILLQLLARPGETGVAIDVFERQDLNVDASGRGVRAHFERNCRRHGVDMDRVRILSTDSLDLSGDDLRVAAGGSLRLVHIDGGHTEQAASHDMATSAVALSPGGVIIVDDYFHEQWRGVSDGVRTFFRTHPEADLVPFAIGGNKVFFCQRAFSKAYRACFEALRVSGYAKQTVMFGEPVLTFAFWRMGPRDRFIRSRWWYAIRGQRGIRALRNWRRRRLGRAAA